jgi:glycosyltransferase involved in cell wall biosynthesis
LISDDNSSDGTPEIIDEISKNHSNIMIFKQKHSLGEFGQKKFLLENSRAKYFQFIDQDDYLDSNNYLEILLSKISEGYDLVFSNTSIETYEGSSLIQRRDNIMSPYNNCETQFDYAKATLSEASLIFYALFSTEILKYYFSTHYESLTNNIAFAEGVLGTELSLKQKCLYISDINKVKTEHGENLSMSLKSYELLSPYMAYINGIFGLSAKLLFWQRIEFLIRLVVKVFPTLMRYVLAKLFLKK